MIKIIREEELNDFVDSLKCYNGGGYHQPLYEFEYKGKKGYFEDTSCGDFGRRYHLEWNGLHLNYDQVGNEDI